MRKSTSSSDSSDDDEEDAFPISKIKFKINETSQQSPIAEESDETKISNAMRAVDKNLGHFATCSRTTGRVSSLEILTRINRTFRFFIFLGRGNDE